MDNLFRQAGCCCHDVVALSRRLSEPDKTLSVCLDCCGEGGESPDSIGYPLADKVQMLIIYCRGLHLSSIAVQL